MKTMSWFKKSCRRLKEKVFGSKKKEKIFTWDQARFEEMMNAESEEDSVESTMGPAQDTNEGTQVRAYPQSTVKKTKGGSAGDMVSSEGKGPNQDIPSTLDAVRLHYRRQNEEVWIKWNRVMFDIAV